MTFLLNYRVFQDFPVSKKLQGFPVEIPYEFFFSTTPGNSTSFVNDPGISYALSSITLWKFHILNRPSLDFFWMDFSLIERVMEKEFNKDMQLGIMAGQGQHWCNIHSDIWQRTKNCTLLYFVDLEKAFNQVPRKVIWWPCKKLALRSSTWISAFFAVAYEMLR